MKKRKPQITLKECGDSFTLNKGGNPEEIFNNFEEAEIIKIKLQQKKKKNYNLEYKDRPGVKERMKIYYYENKTQISKKAKEYYQRKKQEAQKK